MTNEVFYSVGDIAQELGVTDRVVQMHCKELGVPRVGQRIFLIDAKTAIKLREEIHKQAGRPKEVA